MSWSDGGTPLSVVIPVYRTADSMDELLGRAERAWPEGTELIVVDDACPDETGKGALQRGSSLKGEVVFLDRNVGQHAGVLIGLRRASAEFVAVMDGDLQDSPEDLCDLHERLRYRIADGVDVVASGRRGNYSNRSRVATARIYRAAVFLLTLGRVPIDAGMFLVMTRSTRDLVVLSGDPAAPLVPLLGRLGVRIESLPVQRSLRDEGQSSYSSLDRVKVAARSVLVVTPLQPLLARRRSRQWIEPTIRAVRLGPVSRGHGGIDDHDRSAASDRTASKELGQ